ncbi:copia protein [Tanacetum coccineum]
MAETMEQYMSKTRENYGSSITRTTINQDTPFELKGKFLKELRDNIFSGSEHEDANEHIEKVLEIMAKEPTIKLDYHMGNSQNQVSKQILSTCPYCKENGGNQQLPARTLKAFFVTFSRTKSTETSDGLADIQAQLNNLEREIKKVNEKVYAAQVGCEQCKGPHYTKDCPQKEEGKMLEEAYYTQFGTSYQLGGK